MKNQQQARETHLCETSNKGELFFKRMTSVRWTERETVQKNKIQTKCLDADYTGDFKKEK